MAETRPFEIPGAHRAPAAAVPRGDAIRVEVAAGVGELAADVERAPLDRQRGGDEVQRVGRRDSGRTARGDPSHRGRRPARAWRARRRRRRTPRGRGAGGGCGFPTGDAPSTGRRCRNSAGGPGVARAPTLRLIAGAVQWPERGGYAAAQGGREALERVVRHHRDAQRRGGAMDELGAEAAARPGRRAPRRARARPGTRRCARPGDPRRTRRPRTSTPRRTTSAGRACGRRRSRTGTPRAANRAARRASRCRGSAGGSRRSRSRASAGPPSGTG